MEGQTRRGLSGCLAAALVLAVALAGVTFWILNEAAAERQRSMLGGMPPGWTVLIRQRVALPASVRSLEPARPTSADGALAVYDTAIGVWTVFRVDSVFERLAADSLLPEDSFTLSEAAGDTALERWVRWAADRDWNALDVILARSGAEARRNLFEMRVPDYRVIRSAAAALGLRGWQRAERGGAARAAALRDFKAAIGLGAMLIRHEPTLGGFLAGREAVHYGATGLQHLALLMHDSALADEAADAAGWSAPSTATDYDVLAAAPDTALAMAGDSALALGWRAEAMAAVMRARLERPAGRLFGLPGGVARSFDSLATRTTGDAARLARLAAETARTINHMGPRQRMRRFGD